ncbi:hypothetical protein [Pyrolobus fumarii]|uniref:hypothetical protein n=1 Tax=Pyrolobus fumarii TaxID=54252 RepID=UPI001432CCD7|nr:hypothetical protein [Pyrolobus fumarii]
MNVKLHMVCPWDDYDLLDPIARLEELISSGFRDPIIEQLYSVLGSSVGVTGSLLYGGEHRDIDIVVYGVRESVEALDLILEMFKSGKLAPPPYKEYNIVKREVGIKDWIYISRRNPLVFRDLGSNRVYSIRLVGCKEPVRCPDIVARSPVHASIVIVRHLTPPCVTPGLYECRARDGGKLVMLTLRSSLSCLPLGAMIEGIFILEQVKNGIARLVPDGGYVRIRLLQG